MAKPRKAPREGPAQPPLFPFARSRRRSGLFLSAYLAEEAEKVLYRDSRQQRAHEILQRWADLEFQGHLARKETALDADFLREVFGEALGYRSATESPSEYELERNFAIPAVGTADAALGNFRPGHPLSPLVAVELKAADVGMISSVLYQKGFDQSARSSPA